MSLGVLILIFLALASIATLPKWPFSAGWGYYPSGAAWLLILVVIALMAMGRF